MNIKSHGNFKSKLFRMLILVSFLPLLCLAVFSYGKLSEVIESRVEAATVDRLHLSGRIIDRSMETFFAMASFIAEDVEIAEVMAKTEYITYGDLHQDRQKVMRVINSLQSTMNLGVPIYIAGRNPYARFTTTDLFTPLYSDLDSEIFAALDATDKTTLTHLRMAGRDQNMVAISILQKIKNPQSDETLGYVIIDIFADYFAEELSPMPAVQGRNTFLVDGNGVIITDEIYKKYTGYNFFTELVDEMDQGHGRLTYSESGYNYLVYYEELPYSGYTLVQMIPENAMYGEKRSIGYVFLVILLLLSVVAAIISYALSERISTPLRQLSGLMKQAAGGDLSARFDLVCDDEIGEIGNSFNTMLVKMDELIGELFTKQYMLKVAQLNNLKQQINPHFLYNTLETIKWMTKLGNTDAIHSTVVALGAILRYSLSTEKEMVTLGEELEQTYNYLMIQRLRHGQRFDMRIELPEALHSCILPKFLIQPLVENAIVHGLEPKMGSGELIISCCREGDDVYLRVCDNGVGLESLAEKGHGIGLSNVRQRIALYYGDRYGVTLTRTGEVTCAEVVLPWSEEKPKSGEKA